MTSGEQPTLFGNTNLLTRFNFAARVSTARGQPGDGGEIKPADLLGTSSTADPSNVVDRVLAMTSGLTLSSEGHQALVDYVQSPLTYPQGFTGQPNAQQRQAATDARLRGAILLALASSDYQVG